MKSYAAGKSGKGDKKVVMKGGNKSMGKMSSGAKGNRYPK
jgi:hypothetical protein